MEVLNRILWWFYGKTFTSLSSASIDLIILSNSSLSLFSTTFLIDPNSAFERWTNSTSSCCYKLFLNVEYLNDNSKNHKLWLIDIAHLLCWNNKLVLTRCRTRFPRNVLNSLSNHLEVLEDFNFAMNFKVISIR